ncbi:hypothetical protein [Leyella stercorea]|uniref:hypothetical protein n=1 Tax=Leyella stercorea TaxID=363265 RepID=UPI00242F3C47|nr:hypothetical protein [Leyella stercorea]
MHRLSKKCTDSFVGAVETTAPPGASASTVADICVDRCGHLRRPLRTSASTDADICVDRCVT